MSFVTCSFTPADIKWQFSIYFSTGLTNTIWPCISEVCLVPARDYVLKMDELGIVQVIILLSGPQAHCREQTSVSF